MAKSPHDGEPQIMDWDCPTAHLRTLELFHLVKMCAFLATRGREIPRKAVAPPAPCTAMYARALSAVAAAALAANLNALPAPAGDTLFQFHDMVST